MNGQRSTKSSCFSDASEAAVKPVERHIDLSELHRLIGDGTLHMAQAQSDIFEPMLHAIKLAAHVA